MWSLGKSYPSASVSSSFLNISIIMSSLESVAVISSAWHRKLCCACFFPLSSLLVKCRGHYLWPEGVGSNIKANPLPTLLSEFLDSEHLASELQRLPQLVFWGWQLPSPATKDRSVYSSGEVTGAHLCLTLLPPGSILGVVHALFLILSGSPSMWIEPLQEAGRENWQNAVQIKL